MKLWVAVTDSDWFRFLRDRRPDEANFWQPSGGRQFRALQPGEPFLFKLHSPENYIVGGGFFLRYTALPCSLAWEAFQEKNGVADLAAFRARIRKYRTQDSLAPDPVIGCNLLAEPFFWPEDRWIAIPLDWAPNIVQGKTYDTADDVGRELWGSVNARQGLRLYDEQDARPRYGEEYLTRARLGQGAFRILVTDAYHRRCAISGERTLPVLEAAHIKAFAESGPHRICNGLLLRSDFHTLFDRGYITIAPDRHVEVSRRIREEFEKGREYYGYHGKELTVVPDSVANQPSADFLRWHNEHVFAP